MRRSGSSSCMLKSKAESDGEPLSITILNVKELPSYSAERFYMLSELEHNGHSMQFVDDHARDTLERDSRRSEEQTQDTEETQSIASSASSKDSSHLLHMAPYTMLYILWRPEVSIDEFFSEVVYKSIRQIKNVTGNSIANSYSRLQRQGSSASALGVANVELDDMGIPLSPRTAYVSRRSSLEVGSSSKILEIDLDGQDGGSPQLKYRGSCSFSPAESPPRTECRMYLIIDRLCPTSETETEKVEPDDHPDNLANDTDLRSDDFKDVPNGGQEQQIYLSQTKLTRILARRIASHRQLRYLLNGVTIGVSNHPRAAPGLEACSDVVLVGATDRRRAKARISDFNPFQSDDDDPSESQTNNNLPPTDIGRSYLGLLAPERSHVLGVTDSEETDAVQGVLQCLISAEWHDNGTLSDYARRAHQAWCTFHGIPFDDTSAAKGDGIRRISSGGGGSDGSRAVHPTDRLELDAVGIVTLILRIMYWIGVAWFVWDRWLRNVTFPPPVKESQEL